jgi:hypothetical protein
MLSILDWIIRTFKRHIIIRCRYSTNRENSRALQPITSSSHISYIEYAHRWMRSQEHCSSTTNRVEWDSICCNCSNSRDDNDVNKYNKIRSSSVSSIVYEDINYSRSSMKRKTSTQTRSMLSIDSFVHSFTHSFSELVILISDQQDLFPYYRW